MGSAHRGWAIGHTQRCEDPAVLGGGGVHGSCVVSSVADTLDYQESHKILLDSADHLLDSGHQDEALKLYAKVLDRNPSDIEALDGFAAAASQAEPFAWVADDDGDASQVQSLGRALDLPTLHARVLTLIERKDYEAALIMLSQGRQRFPDDRAISRSIRAIKAHLERRYLRRLGSLDRVPALVDRPSEKASRDHEDVARWVDGVATLGDVLEVTNLGRFRTLRALDQMRSAGRIQLAPHVRDTIVESRQAEPASGEEAQAPWSESRLLSGDTLTRTALLLVRAELRASAPATPPAAPTAQASQPPRFTPQAIRAPVAAKPEAQRAPRAAEPAAQPLPARTRPPLPPLPESTGPTLAVEPSTPKPRRTLLWGAALGVLGAAAVVFFLRADTATAPAHPPAAPMFDTEAQPTQGPAAGPVEEVAGAPTVSDTAVTPTLVIELRSEPSGAMVEIDGRTYGPTPASIELTGDNVDGRQIDIRFHRDGFEDRSVAQRLRPGTATVFTTLEPTPVRRVRRRRAPTPPSGFKNQPY